MSAPASPGERRISFRVSRASDMAACCSCWLNTLRKAMVASSRMLASVIPASARRSCTSCGKASSEMEPAISPMFGIDRSSGTTASPTFAAALTVPLMIDDVAPKIMPPPVTAAQARKIVATDHTAAP